MRLAVAVFGLFVAGLGAAGVASPQRLLDVVTRVQSRMGLYAIAALRIAVGAAMLLAAPTSRAPLYLQVLGALSLLSGVFTPLVGEARFRAILGWWRARTATTVRLWSLFVALFGLSLVWAVFPLVRPA